jgi:hypothetical protein
MEKLRLGKGVFFVKGQLRRLRQGDDTWEADFFPIPRPVSEPTDVWIGLVLSHTDNYLLAQRTVAEPPTVNDLANLLAQAMRRPLVELAHRPQMLYLRSRPEWGELLPHLKEVGIQVVSQEALPKWDAVFGDLYAQVERARSARGAKLTRGRTPAGKTTAKGDRWHGRKNQ